MLRSVRHRKSHTLLPRSGDRLATSNSIYKHHHSAASSRLQRVRFYAVALSAALWTLLTMYGHAAHRPWLAYLRRLSWLDLSRRATVNHHTARTVILSDHSLDLFPVGKPSFNQNLVPIPHILDPDYNDLEFESSFGKYSHFKRIPPENDADLYHDQRREFLHEIDDKYLRAYYDGYEDQLVDMDAGECRSAGWQFAMKPNCNVFHELALEYAPELTVQPYFVEYLAHGYYRESYRLRNKYWKAGTPKNHQPIRYPESEQMVLKHLRFHEDFPIHIKNQRAVLREAVLMEALSIRPTFANFYGYCSTSTLLQAGNDFVHQVVPKRFKWQEDDGRATPQQLRKHPDPLNTLTPSLKLKYAMSMAEGLAELHGYEKGVVSHDDISLEQWVLTDDGKLVLSDVNNAIVMDWNEADGSYCPYEIDYPYETVDLWGYGTLVFSLLTGLYPFHENADPKENRKLILDAHVPKIDPKYQNRSLIEERLYNVVQKCLRPLPEDRMDIFSVVDYLRETERVVAVQQKVTG